MTNKMAYIVSYRIDADGVCCTNIAMAACREDVEAEYGECDFIAINPAKEHEVEALRRRGCPIVECERAIDEEYQGAIDNIINAGIKAMIAEKMGFDPKRIYLLEMDEREGLPVWIAFEVNGQGYAWDIQHDSFTINNAYGDRFFGEDE